MKIENLPKTKECYSRTGVGLWVVLRESTFSMLDANIIDIFDDTLYDAVAREVDWAFDENY